MTASAREQHRRSACGRRDGVAAVEFAVCLPVLLVLTFGMIEACTMMFLKQSLSIAAYEGAHTLVRPNATPAEAKKVVQAILTARRVEGATVSISPGNFTSLPEGDPF
ncbi:MAG: TadE family protein, partial [Planctomycetota bacterium]